MSSSYGGTTAFDRLRARFDGQPHVCEECGFVDDEGEWTAATTGATIEYRHECPSCGDATIRRYRL